MATHQIISKELERLTQRECFIKLSRWEEIKMKWYLKRYMVQEGEFKRKVLLGVIGGVIAAILAYYIK